MAKRLVQKILYATLTNLKGHCIYFSAPKKIVLIVTYSDTEHRHSENSVWEHQHEVFETKKVIWSEQSTTRIYMQSLEIGPVKSQYRLYTSLLCDPVRQHLLVRLLLERRYKVIHPYYNTVPIDLKRSVLPISPNTFKKAVAVFSF